MKVAAPAKINLAIHVTGQRPDGYHVLESLVVFADVGDVITLETAERDSLTFSGQFGHLLKADAAENLVAKARDALREACPDHACPPVAIHLEKKLPLASGIGGGSADAAATLKGLNELYGLGLSIAQLCQIGITLGADVPMCLHGQPLIARGIGEIIEPVAALPPLHLLLVNPGVEVSTPAIFRLLSNKANESLPIISPLAGEMSASPTEGGSRASTSLASATVKSNAEICSLVAYLRTTRNDLEPPALTLQSIIGDVLSALNQTGALFARMSGSGATCFGLYVSPEAKDSAKATLMQTHPDWWVA